MTINKARLVANGTKVYDGIIDFEGSNLIVSGRLGQTFIASGIATMENKHVKNNARLINVNGLTLVNQNNLLSNYEPLAVADTSVTVTAKPVSLSAPTLNKTYDGGFTYNMTASDLNNMSLQLVGGDRVDSASVVFDTKNVGQNKKVSITGVTIGDGNEGANYNVSLLDNNSSNIIPAPLTIKAAHDAKFSSESDTQNFRGVIINGFVNGETISELSGTLIVTRTNATQNAVGVYANVLVPSGYTANNYAITYTNGDYRILGAGNALIGLAATNTTYEEAVNYLPRMTARYFDGTNISNLTTTALSGVYRISSGAGAATFAVTVINPTNSSSGNLVVGGYDLTNATITSAFPNLTLVGTLNVSPKSLNVNNLGISNVTKIYDGGTNISGLSLNRNAAQSSIIEGDNVGIEATGTYANKNVGVNKAVDINIVLRGSDAKNYALSSTQVQGNFGTISQLANVDWVGPASGGRWSNASYWRNGALPDLANVASVNIPVGANILFDSALVGQVNSNIINNGTLTFNSVGDFNFNSNVSGVGDLVHSGLGELTLSGNNSFTGDININTSRLVLANENATGSGWILSNGGSLRSTTTLARLEVNGAVDLLSDILTRGNQTYNGSVTLSGGSAYDLETEIIGINEAGVSVATLFPVSIKQQRLESSAGNIRFNDKLKANGSYRENQSAFIKANNVYFEGEVGKEPDKLNNGKYDIDHIARMRENLYILRVNANQTHLNADITTFGGQQFNGLLETEKPSIFTAKLTVGGDSETRTLLSLDPFININGSVDDSTVGIHTLVTRAIYIERRGITLVPITEIPTVNVTSGIGLNKALKAYQPGSFYQPYSGSEPLVNNLSGFPTPINSSGGNISTVDSFIAPVRFATGSGYQRYIPPTPQVSDQSNRLAGLVAQLHTRSSTFDFQKGQNGRAVVEVGNAKTMTIKEDYLDDTKSLQNNLNTKQDQSESAKPNEKASKEKAADQKGGGLSCKSNKKSSAQGCQVKR